MRYGDDLFGHDSIGAGGAEGLTVSATPKIRRQGKGQPKTRFQILLASVNYDVLYHLARQKGISMSRVVNDWLKEKRSERST